MDDIDQIFFGFGSHKPRYPTTIVCLFTGEALPKNCAAMARMPMAPIGQTLDRSFPDHLAQAHSINSAMHDGAVMLGRTTNQGPYTIAGWSFRLFPPESGTLKVENRGSAFNSCLAMSLVSNVDRVYLVTGETSYRFERGSAMRL